MVNLLKVKTIRNFINVVKIGIVLFKYWADMFIRLWTIRFSVGKVSFAERRYSKLR